MVEVKQINHPSFPEWLKVEAVNDNEISQLAKQGLPIILPWGKRPIRLGTCYKSSLQSTQEGPFLEESPFMLSDLYTMPKTLQREGGTDSRYKSVNTSRVVETGDHLSLGFGVGVGLPFLASVSVKGQFDQHVHENRDVCSRLMQGAMLTTDSLIRRQFERQSNAARSSWDEIRD